MGDDKKLHVNNVEFKNWLIGLNELDRVRIMTNISEGLAKRSVPNIKIKETLVQLSQRCSVMLVKLSDTFIKRQTRRRKVKRLKSEKRHQSKGHLPSLKGCVNTLTEQDHQNNQISPIECERDGSKSDHHQKKAKRINKKIRELFGDDDDDCGFEQPMKKLKRAKVGESSAVGTISEMDTTRIVQTNKFPKKDCVTPDEEWNKMGLPSPAQRSKSILNGDMEESVLSGHCEIHPQDQHLVMREASSVEKIPEKEGSKPRVGSIKISKSILNENMAENVLSENSEIPQDQHLVLREASSVEKIPEEESSKPIVGSIRVRSISELTIEGVQETPQNDEEAKKIFGLAYKFYFNEKIEGDIKKLGELLYLAGTYYSIKNERIERAKQLSSEDLAMEEKERAELNFLSQISYRGSEFVPLFLEILERFENSGNRCTLFIMLFCKILHHAQSFYSDKMSLSLDPIYIDLSREVTSLMVSNCKPGFDIFKDYKIKSDELVKYVEKSYQLMFPVDESQSISNINKDQQVNKCENDDHSTGVTATSHSLEESLSPAASHLEPEEQQMVGPSNSSYSMTLDSLQSVNSQIIPNPDSVGNHDLFSNLHQKSASNLISNYSEISLIPFCLHPQNNQEVSVIKSTNDKQHPIPQLTKEPSISAINGLLHTFNIKDLPENHDIQPAESSKQLSTNLLNAVQQRFNLQLGVKQSKPSEQSIHPNQINSIQKANHPNPSSQEINPKDVQSDIVRSQTQVVSQHTEFNLPSRSQSTNSNANIQHSTLRTELHVSQYKKNSVFNFASKNQAPNSISNIQRMTVNRDNIQPQQLSALSDFNTSQSTHLSSQLQEQTSRTELAFEPSQINSRAVTSVQHPSSHESNPKNTQSATNTQRANTYVACVSQETVLNLPSNAINVPTCLGANIQDKTMSQDIRQPVSPKQLNRLNISERSHIISTSHIVSTRNEIYEAPKLITSIQKTKNPNLPSHDSSPNARANTQVAYVSPQQTLLNLSSNSFNRPTYSNVNIQNMPSNQVIDQPLSSTNMSTVNHLNISKPRYDLQGGQCKSGTDNNTPPNQITPMQITRHPNPHYNDKPPKNIPSNIASTHAPFVTQQMVYNLPPNPINQPTYSNGNIKGMTANEAQQMQTLQKYNQSQPRYHSSLQSVQSNYSRTEFNVPRNQIISDMNLSSHDRNPQDKALTSTQLPRVSPQNTFNLPSYPNKKPTNSLKLIYNPPSNSRQQQSIRDTTISQPQYPLNQNHPSYSGLKHFQSASNTQLGGVTHQIKSGPPLYPNNQPQVANSSHRFSHGPRMKSIDAKTNRILTKAVDEFMASKSRSSLENLVQPASTQNATLPGLNHNTQDISFNFKATPQYYATKPTNNYNPGLNNNSAHPPSNFELTTQQKNSYVSKLISYPPMQQHQMYQPQPVVNPAGDINNSWLQHYQRQSSDSQLHHSETISQATWLQPKSARRVVSKPGSNPANLKFIQRLPQNGSIPTADSQQMHPETPQIQMVPNNGVTVELYP